MQTLAPGRASRQLIPINPLMLSVSEALCFDVYLKVDADSTPKLYCSRRLQLNPRQIQQLLEAGITKLYIESDSYSSYLSELHSQWEVRLSRNPSVEADRTALMYEVVRAVLGEQFSSNDTSSIVDTCHKLSNAIVTVLHEGRMSISTLHEIMLHDSSLCTHSANVAVYSAILARELGYCGSELQQIVMGALLHDIGNLDIPNLILAKPERLNEFERREVQKHASIGLRRLISSQKQLSFEQLMMVYQHHEKLNGSGYPVGILADEIHPWAKLCAVVSAFAALTADRPHRKPLTQATALAVLDKLTRTDLDEQIVKCWKSLLRDATPVRSLI